MESTGAAMRAEIRSIVLKIKPVWWFDQKKPEPTVFPGF
jgi:hypothetical protein